MSSLRLALKQSLQESAAERNTSGNVSSPTHSHSNHNENSDEDDSTRVRGEQKKIKAANTIQVKWKQGHKKDNLTSGTATSETKKEKESTESSQHKQQQQRSKHHQHSSNRITSKKPSCVPPPFSDILTHSQSLSVSSARQYVRPGLRVKVRFVVQHKNDSAKKRKWFGGRIAKISQERSKIRIKYDDGTTEVTRFPDKDVVVDDTDNGQHADAMDPAVVQFFQPTIQSVEAQVHVPPAINKDDESDLKKSQSSVSIAAMAATAALEGSQSPQQASSTPAETPVLADPGSAVKRKRGRPPKSPRKLPPEQAPSALMERAAVLPLVPAVPTTPSATATTLGSMDQTTLTTDENDKDSLFTTYKTTAIASPLMEEEAHMMLGPKKEATATREPLVAAEMAYADDSIQPKQATMTTDPPQPTEYPVSFARESLLEGGTSLATQHEDATSAVDQSQADGSHSPVLTDPPTLTRTSFPSTHQLDERPYMSTDKSSGSDDDLPPVIYDAPPEVQDTVSNVARRTADEETALQSSGTLPLDELDDAPIVRSGRRAAHQANERITFKQELVMLDEPKSKKKRMRHVKDGEDDDEEVSQTSDDDSQWVQCDGCGKWRIIPTIVVATLPKQWFCADNIWDPKRASCEAPEQTPKQAAKERKKRKKMQARLRAEATTVEAVMDGTFGGVESEPAQQPVQSPSPVLNDDAMARASSTEMLEADELVDNAGKDKKSKQMRSQQSLEDLAGLDDSIDSKPRRRGRPRSSQNRDKPSEMRTQQQEDADNLEWVQCEKCEKWRKLPSHISAEELPDVWFCNLNTWNPLSAFCEAPEDKADGLQDVGFNSGGGGGKLAYRTLIFGSNGRKANRPISERTRAEESLFRALYDDDEDAPPVCLYANSSVFQARSRNNPNVDDDEPVTFLDLMSNTNLWAELKAAAAAAQPLDTASAYDKPINLHVYTYATLPLDIKPAMKELVLLTLADKSLTGDEVLLEAQRGTMELPESCVFARAYCSANVIVTTLCEMAKEGAVEVIQKMGPSWSLNDWNPRYCKSKRGPVVLTRGVDTLNHCTRALKIAKPWKVQ
jgi:hypothetical protein